MPAFDMLGTSFEVNTSVTVVSQEIIQNNWVSIIMASIQIDFTSSQRMDSIRIITAYRTVIASSSVTKGCTDPVTSHRSIEVIVD